MGSEMKLTIRCSAEIPVQFDQKRSQDICARSHIDLAQPLNVSASGQSSISFQVKITTLRISRCISGGGHGMGYVPSE